MISAMPSKRRIRRWSVVWSLRRTGYLVLVCCFFATNLLMRDCSGFTFLLERKSIAQRSTAGFNSRGPFLYHPSYRQAVTTLCLYLSNGVAPSESNDAWYPRALLSESDSSKGARLDSSVWDLEGEAVKLAADLICNRLQSKAVSGEKTNCTVPAIVKGRFIDLTCEEAGEEALESLFDTERVVGQSAEVLLATVMVIQSLCIMGTCVGLKGPPEQLKRLVAHLDARNDPTLLSRDLAHWDSDSVRRLKYRMDRVPALQLLTELKWKRAPQGAYDLLVRIGAWGKHEDLALLRSGFPLRFTEAELRAADNVIHTTCDVDEVLGIRKDFRSQKVYTIDGSSTWEIDDGLSVEVITADDGSHKHRLWIHIADAERWANEDMVDLARKRVTSLYLPTGSLPMFPPAVSRELMSLHANRDCCALSMSIELNDDGSINLESLAVSPSLIRVTYRLTYDDVDEMLEEGIGYKEEWELGALLDASLKRRDYRMERGSTERLVPNPIPFVSVSAFPDRNAPDGIGVSLNVQVSHNAGQNVTASSEGQLSTSVSCPAPVSSANLLVTEMMILAGEAIAQWKCRQDEAAARINGSRCKLPNQMRLPFRSQPEPDFKSRSRERAVMTDLLESQIGNGWCHAWYTRRFLQSVKVVEFPSPHSGLGLSCYVQWTSPIRRFTDLQVHMSVKRYLRRQRVSELMQQGQRIPEELCQLDLGLPFGAICDGSMTDDVIGSDDVDRDLNFLDGLGLAGAARTLQRQSQQYWIYEYIRRQSEKDPHRAYPSIVLGCVDPERQQYAVYVEPFGLEHRYTSPRKQSLDTGTTLQLKVDAVSPRFGILTFVQAV